MEIKNIQPTAKFKAEFKIGQSIELEVEFISLGLEGLDFVGKDERPKLSSVVRHLLIKAVKGWDLTKDGVAMPCNDETKAENLPILLGLDVKGGGVLGIHLFNFARDGKHFLNF